MKAGIAPGCDARKALGFNPDIVIAREPGVLLDPHFLGALHAELEAEMGPEAAASALRQIGCLQGLRHAEQAIGTTAAAGEDEFAPLCPPLAIRCGILTSGYT